MNYADKMFESVVANAPLVAALALAFWWAFPRMLRSSLNNGSGDIIRAIIRAENAEQSTAHAAVVQRVVDAAIARHEEGDARIARAVARTARRTAAELVTARRRHGR